MNARKLTQKKKNGYTAPPEVRERIAAVSEVDFSMLSIGTEVVGDLGALPSLKACKRLSVCRLPSLTFALSDVQTMPSIVHATIFKSAGVTGLLSDLRSHPTLQQLMLSYCPHVEGEASDLSGLERLEVRGLGISLSADGGGDDGGDETAGNSGNEEATAPPQPDAAEDNNGLKKLEALERDLQATKGVMSVQTNVANGQRILLESTLSNLSTALDEINMSLKDDLTMAVHQERVQPMYVEVR